MTPIKEIFQMNRHTVALLALGVLMCRAVPIAGQTSKGGVTVGAYVGHAGLVTELHVTVENDNDFMVKNVAYVIQWTCGSRAGTTAPGATLDPVLLVAASQTYDTSVNGCSGTFAVQDVRLISFDKWQPAPAPTPPAAQASSTPASMSAQQANQANVSMQDTVKFLSDHAAPKLVTTCHMSDSNGDTADDDFEMDIDKIELLTDGKTIRMTYRSFEGPTKNLPPVLPTSVFDFNLSTIDLDSISIAQPFAIICNDDANRLQEHLDYSSSPEWWLVAKFGQGDQARQAMFPAESQAMAQRMQNALAHAAVLAGNGKPEPF
jgi:hypothetical protein